MSSLIGALTSTLNVFGPLHYQELDKCKTLGLKKAKGIFDTLIKLTKEAILLLDKKCLLDKKFVCSVKKLQYPDIAKAIYTDASMHEWRAQFEGMSTGGLRINTEKNWHINALELKSILSNLMLVVKDRGIHVRFFQIVLLP